MGGYYLDREPFNVRAYEKARVEALREKQEELAKRAGLTGERKDKFLAQLKEKMSPEEKEAEKRRKEWEELGE